MVRWGRDPLLICGVVLFFLGVGNWILGQSKMKEYTERARGSNSGPGVERFGDFPELTARTNAALLERLQSEYSHAAAKLDFYRVVESGGRAVSLGGLLLIVAALGRSLWHHRTRGDGIAPGVPKIAGRPR